MASKDRKQSQSVPSQHRFTHAQLEAANLEYCRRQAINGNPFPLVATQWPFMLVSDVSEQQYFEGDPDNPNDPCLRLDTWQRHILVGFFRDDIAELRIKGCTKAGKGASTSIAANLWFWCFRECKVILTSQRFDHAKDVIFGEVSAWHEKMKHPVGIATKTGISVDEQRYITIANPQSGEGFSGQHGPRTLFLFDEATSVPDGFYEDAQKQARKITALANPRTLSGWFRSGYPDTDPDVTQDVSSEFGLRRCITISGQDCINVRAQRLERPLSPPGGITIDGRDFGSNEFIPPEYFAKVRTLIPNQIDYARYQGISRHRDKNHVRVFAEGRFPMEDAELQVILGSWLNFHIKAWHDEIKVDCFALDVARSLDGDCSALASGSREGCREIITWQYNNVIATVSHTVDMIRTRYGIDLTDRRNPIVVDTVGIGAGAADQLKAMNVWVIEFNGASSSGSDPATYANLRAESYGDLGRRFNPDDQWRGQSWAIPPDPELHEDLVAPEKVFVGGDGLRWLITPKTRSAGTNYSGMTVSQKIGRSPDKGDAVAMLFHGVREFHLLEEWASRYSRPLTVSPAPPPKEGEEEKTPDTNPPENECELLKYLEEEYGDGQSPQSDSVQEEKLTPLQRILQDDEDW